MLQGVGGVVSLLRREKYDLVLDLQGNCKSGLFTLLSGGKQRYGFGRDGVREWPNLLATNRRVLLGEIPSHITDRSLAVARAALPGGETPVASGPLTILASAEARTVNRLRDFKMEKEPLLVLHYGTTWKTKLWPLDHWQSLAIHLVKESAARLILTWGNDDELRAAEAICEACAGAAVIWPRGTLTELAALLSKADLVVGGDTGPIHISAALGVPTVSLYRATDGRRNGPRGDRHIRLQAAMDCSPCRQKKCAKDAECGGSIRVDDVLAAVENLLEEKGR